ncbi:OmpA family protein [Prosthecobacter vanneervenii]|uniref:Outer membrane protein OmpA-like peptidoglycan-associated protein n=1 Tax=Prosthecobacter vanneervenii TaxID=48466 RepID=A0A7W7Y9N2_9BACT|nr:OmpA family protein [Prosthecobacter vanneervenii]MBB5031845.1 outer membrane protein OmpA-like peptidoglycan-associated protein [Prosthecobacter vanneervenii]
MRLKLLLFMLILLPMATGVHAWLFCRDNLPVLTQVAMERLKAAGVRDPVVELRFFDLAVSGEAPDPAARQRALASMRTLVPLRLRPGAEHIVVRASLSGRLEGGTLHLSGWFPQGDEIKKLSRLLADLRPDLKLDTKELHTSAEVSWPEGVKLPLTTTGPMLKPLIDTLRVPAELHIRATEEAIVLSGLLPDITLKAELVAALAEAAAGRVVDPAGLKASPHVLPASFAKPHELAAFVGGYFRVPGPRSFDILSDGIPHLRGTATRQLESVWLALLRPVTGAAKVDVQFTLVPSVYHFPGYHPLSKISPEALKPLRESLHASTILFDAGSASLPPQEQTKLALLAPALLAAGPALGLVIGAHPDPGAPLAAEKALGQARAEAVLSFMVQQGVPAADISATVFDSVPAGSPSAPASPRSVELLVK